MRARNCGAAWAHCLRVPQRRMGNLLRWHIERRAGDSPFARNDAPLYTPLCLVLAALYGVLAFRRRGQ